jgi:hypothetical protein
MIVKGSESKLSNKIFPIILGFFLILGFAPLQGQVQEKTIHRSQQFWFQYFQHNKLNDRWTWINDGGFRWKVNPLQPSQYVVRTALAYDLKQPVRISAGFAHLGFYKGQAMNRIEFRPHQEVTINQKLGKISTKHRFRAEQRIFRGCEEGHLTGDKHFNLRFRYLFGLKIPLWDLSHQHPGRHVFLGLADEINIHVGEEIIYDHFSRNRLLISPGIQWDAHWILKLTYNRQWTTVNAPATFKAANVFWIQLVHKLDWRSS